MYNRFDCNVSKFTTGVHSSVSQRIREFGNTWRWSVGAGVVFPTWVGRFEANYVAVLSAQVSACNR